MTNIKVAGTIGPVSISLGADPRTMSFSLSVAPVLYVLRCWQRNSGYLAF
ncbi:MAG: hypothetical protein OXN84_05030 [Albidovulum sp.]|nr:hypothetical protein [Albidovulum sp.]